jgi:hypothetical protein
MYGLPYLDDERKAELRDERLILGGCCISGDDPAWRCPKCGWQGWRKRPMAD